MAGPVANSDMIEWDRWVQTNGPGRDHLVTAYPFSGERAGFTSDYRQEGLVLRSFNSPSARGVNGRSVVQMRRYYARFGTDGTTILNDHRTTSGSTGPAYGFESGQGYVYTSNPGSSLGKRIYEVLNAGGNPDRDHMLSFSSNEGGYAWTGRSWWIPLRVNGCTQSGAINFNPNANVDNGTCIFGTAPNITSFSFANNPVCPGDSSLLSWSVTFNPAGSATVTGPPGQLGSTSGTTAYNAGTVVSTPGIYSISATNVIGTSTATATLSNLEVTDVNFTNPGNSSEIILGNSFILQWASSGSNNTTTIDNGIGSVNNSGNVVVTPSSTTTYVVTTVGTCNFDNDNYTVIVYNPPESDLNAPTSVNYDTNPTISYEYSFANLTAKVDITYTYLDSTTSTDTVTLTPSDLYGTTSGSFVDTVPYNDLGPSGIEYVLTVTGNGGSSTFSDTLVVNIDTIPVTINIPPTDDRLKDENPVFSPIDVINSAPYDIEGIDIPVEIRSDKPIKVSKDGGETFFNINELET